MNYEEKRAFATKCEEVADHTIVQAGIAEYCENMGIEPDTIEYYGLLKVVSYTAQIARAMALEIDPETLRMTPAEAAHFEFEEYIHIMSMPGLPTVIIVASVDGEEPETPLDTSEV